MRTDFSYSNTLGWNTFPIPKLTEQNKANLTRCAEDILLAREHYFPATIADMYDRDRMDTEFSHPAGRAKLYVRAAHETPSESLRDRNDEVLERIYIGTPKESLRERRFKNDIVLPLATQKRSCRENGWKSCLTSIPK